VAGAFAASVPAAGAYLLYRYSEPVSEFIRGMGVGGPLAFVLVFALFTGLAIVPTWIQSILAGFLFGFSIGTASAVGSCALGSLVGYALGRMVTHDRVQALINEHPTWAAVRRGLVGSGQMKALVIMLLVRLPSTPFALTNLAMAAIRVPIVPYFVGAAVGIIPRTALAAWAGSGLKKFTRESVSGMEHPYWDIAIGVVLYVIAVTVVGLIAQRALRHVTREAPGAPTAQNASGPSASEEGP
jgi:uncharacterized membrane protein YdjX (TVP38/TMEM64 family)